LEKFAPHPEAATVVLLGLAWFLLALSLLGAFLAIYCSGKSIQRQFALAEYRHKRYRKSQDPELADVPLEREQDVWAEAIPKIDAGSVIAMLLGLFFLFVFAFCNLPTKKSSKDAQTATIEFRVADQEGANIKPSTEKKIVVEIRTVDGRVQNNSASNSPVQSTPVKAPDPRPQTNKPVNNQKP
jgi:hypothetical protein